MLYTQAPKYISVERSIFQYVATRGSLATHSTATKCTEREKNEWQNVSNDTNNKNLIRCMYNVEKEARKRVRAFAHSYNQRYMNQSSCTRSNIVAVLYRAIYTRVYRETALPFDETTTNTTKTTTLFDLLSLSLTLVQMQYARIFIVQNAMNEVHSLSLLAFIFDVFCHVFCCIFFRCLFVNAPWNRCRVIVPSTLWIGCISTKDVTEEKAKIGSYFIQLVFATF